MVNYDMMAGMDDRPDPGDQAWDKQAAELSRELGFEILYCPLGFEVRGREAGTPPVPSWMPCARSWGARGERESRSRSDRDRRRGDHRPGGGGRATAREAGPGREDRAHPRPAQRGDRRGRGHGPRGQQVLISPAGAVGRTQTTCAEAETTTTRCPS